MTEPIRVFREFAKASTSHQKGVYYFGIIASACYFESVLEEFTVSWCKRESATRDDYRSRLMDVVATDVARATGLEAWKKWMHALYDIDLPKALEEHWKALDILFKLRNQLAHGRTTKFTHFWREDGRFVGMTLKGSAYEMPFTFLLEKKVIQVASGEVPSAQHLLNCDVVAYFCDIVDRCLTILTAIPVLKSLDLNIAEPVRAANPPKVDG